MSAERARLERERRAVEVRLAEARAVEAAARSSVLDVEAEGAELDVHLAALDLRSSGLPESAAASVARTRTLLANTGHPVLDVLVLPTTPSGRRLPSGHRVRVEFRHDGHRVGVLLAYAESSEAVLFAGPGWGVNTREEGDLRAEVATEPEGAPLDEEGDLREHASNDHLRRVAATESSVRERATRVAGDRLRELDVEATPGTRRLDMVRSRVRSLLSLEEGFVIATAEEAEATLRLLGDLAAGAPEEWALARFVGSVT